MLSSEPCKVLTHGNVWLKGKVHPRTGHERPEEEQMYCSTLSLTSVLGRGGWSMPHPSHFIPSNEPVANVEKVGWAPGLVNKSEDKKFTSAVT
jgi:hypothetical protein